MDKRNLRVTADQFEKHVTMLSNQLATAAGLKQHEVNLFVASEVAADGDLQVRVQSSQYTSSAVNQRAVRENVHEIWSRADNGDKMLFGYSESWHSERRHRALGSAAIRFFYKSGLHGAERSATQLFRFEWADRTLEPGTSEYAFPAKGAATPHWHYDGLRADHQAEELIMLRELLQQPSIGVDGGEVKEFDDEEGDNESPAAPLEAWFGAIHFPVRTCWHEHRLSGADF